ncbi:MAG: hypothetical protein GF341_07225 [candidate division Zixibacteria bacterium]|nr:hypothetical protein [candidate division Zixibacteria bacterium]
MRLNNLKRSALFVALVFALSLLVSTTGSVAGDDTSWRVAAGWDNGVSIRARLYQGWGIGLHYQHRGTSRVIGGVAGYPSDQWNEYGLIVFGDMPLYEHLRIGPFAEFVLARDDISDFDTEAYGIIFGIRPSIRVLSDRFLLETRFGMQIVRREDLPTYGGHSILQDPSEDEWATGLYGDKVGLNSRLTFMFLF